MLELFARMVRLVRCDFLLVVLVWYRWKRRSNTSLFSKAGPVGPVFILRAISAKHCVPGCSKTLQARTTLLAGKHPSPLAPTGSPSDVDAFGDFKRIIDFDANISHRTLQFRVPQQKLDRTQILGFPVDERHLYLCGRSPTVSGR